MSKAKYRIELHHDPASGSAVCWTADVYDMDDNKITDFWAGTREDAFDKAQEWIIRAKQTPDPPATVYLTEDGEIVPAHEVTSDVV